MLFRVKITGADALAPCCYEMCRTRLWSHVATHLSHSLTHCRQPCTVHTVTSRKTKLQMFFGMRCDSYGKIHRMPNKPFGMRWNLPSFSVSVWRLHWPDYDMPMQVGVLWTFLESETGICSVVLRSITAIVSFVAYSFRILTFNNCLSGSLTCIW